MMNLRNDLGEAERALHSEADNLQAQLEAGDLEPRQLEVAIATLVTPRRDAAAALRNAKDALQRIPPLGIGAV